MKKIFLFHEMLPKIFFQVTLSEKMCKITSIKV